MNIWWFVYPNGLRGWLKDWRLGWDEGDLRSAIKKMDQGRPGEAIVMTHREMAALRAEAKANTQGLTLLTEEGL